MREFFRSSWQKHNRGEVLEPMEALVADVIALHPEYHQLFSDENKDLDRDYLAENGESNPFLHMGMHISLREQVNTDRPTGIKHIYKQILIKMGDQHQAEHQMIECLAESLWQAQQTSQFPDENEYLRCLRQIIQS